MDGANVLSGAVQLDNKTPDSSGNDAAIWGATNGIPHVFRE